MAKRAPSTKARGETVYLPDIPNDFTNGTAAKPAKAAPPDTSKARYKVLLDLGQGDLGEPGPANPGRLSREAGALAKASERLWNLRAPDVLRAAAERLEQVYRDRRI